MWMRTMPVLRSQPWNNHYELQLVIRPSKEQNGVKRCGGVRIRWNRRWRCSPACTMKGILYRYQLISILRKFHLCWKHSYQEKFQKYVTRGWKSRSFQAFFTCISMGHLFGGVRPSKALYGGTALLLKLGFWGGKCKNWPRKAIDIDKEYLLVLH